METAAEVVSIFIAAGETMSAQAALSNALRLADMQMANVSIRDEAALREVEETGVKVMARMASRLPPEALVRGEHDSIYLDRMKIATGWGCLQGMSMEAARLVNEKETDAAERMLNRMTALGVGLRSLQDRINRSDEQEKQT